MKPGNCLSSPGIKGVARRAMPVRPLRAGILNRHGEERKRETSTIKYCNPALLAHPADGHRPRFAQILVELGCYQRRYGAL